MKRTLFLLGPVTALAAWWFVGVVAHPNPIYFPLLPEVANSFFSILTSNGYTHLWATAYRVVVGFALAGLLAVPLGVCIASVKQLYYSLEFFIDFFRSLPSPTLFPLFLLFFGIGDGAKIAAAFFVAFWVILINTIYGVWNQPKVRKQVGIAFGAKPIQIFKEITILDALPQIFIGLRLALSSALILVVVSEMLIGTKTGLGLKVFDSYASYRIPQLYAYILIIGLLGYVLNKIFLFFEQKIIHWTGK